MLIKRIDRLIDVKILRKEKKEEELRSLVDTLRNVEERIRMVKEEHRRTILQLENSLLEASNFQTLKEYLLLLEIEEDELESERRSLESKIRKVKEELIGIFKDLKKLEILKSKALSLKQKEASKRLQRLLDELSLRKRDRAL